MIGILEMKLIKEVGDFLKFQGQESDEFSIGELNHEIVILFICPNTRGLWRKTKRH